MKELKKVYARVGFIFLIFVFLFVKLIIASPPPIPNYLEINSIKYTSNKLIFVEDYDFRVVDENNLRKNVMFVLPSYKFILSENYSKIKVTIGDDIWINENLLDIKWNENTTIDGKTYYLYNLFDARDEYNKNVTNNFQNYDNSIIKIYLDDELVREYSIKYYPGSNPYNSEDNDNNSWIRYLILVIVVLVVIATLFFIFRKKK